MEGLETEETPDLVLALGAESDAAGKDPPVPTAEIRMQAS